MVIAYKAIHFAPGFSAVDRQVAACIIAHFNVKTGQCDPSNGRLATVLGIDERSVRRATADLCGDDGLFLKTSHGGKSGRASYVPNWAAFRSIAADVDRSIATGHEPGDARTNRAKSPYSQATKNRAKSPYSDDENSDREQGEIVRDNRAKLSGEQGEIALQTHLRNSLKELKGANVSAECEAVSHHDQSNSDEKFDGLLNGVVSATKPPGYRSQERAATKGCSKSDAAWMAATRRLDAAIARADAGWRSDMWVLTDETDRDLAIKAELTRRGEGLATLEAAVRVARLQAGMRNRGHDHD